MAKMINDVDAAADAVQQAQQRLHDAEEAHKSGGPREPVVAALVARREAAATHAAAIDVAAKTAKKSAGTKVSELP